MREELLRIDNGAYEADKAIILKQLYLQVFAGEISGILFHNARERDALLHILSGEHTLSYGRMYLCGVLLSPSSYGKDLKNNIYIISETNRLIPQLTIAENIFFDRFKFICLNPSPYYKQTQILFERFGLAISSRKPVRLLTNAESITVCLLKAYIRQCRLIVLSNIISLLDYKEIELLFILINQLKGLGMSFLILDSSDTVLFDKTQSLSIIKNGSTIGMFETDTVDKESVSYLYKNTINLETPFSFTHSYLNTTDPVMVFQGVSGQYIKNLNLELHRGEILKLLYSNEANYKELIALLKGTLPVVKGEIRLEGSVYGIRTINEAYRSGIGFIEENPTEVMLFQNMNVLDNVCIPLADKIPGFWMKKKYKKSASKLLKGILPPSCLSLPLSDVPRNLLQKMVYCKWLLYNPKVLICIKPFSTPDLEANQISEQMIQLLAKKGVGIIIISPYYGDFVNQSTLL